MARGKRAPINLEDEVIDSANMTYRAIAYRLARSGVQLTEELLKNGIPTDVYFLLIDKKLVPPLSEEPFPDSVEVEDEASSGWLLRSTWDNFVECLSTEIALAEHYAGFRAGEPPQPSEREPVRAVFKRLLRPKGLTIRQAALHFKSLGIIVESTIYDVLNEDPSVKPSTLQALADGMTELTKTKCDWHQLEPRVPDKSEWERQRREKSEKQTRGTPSH